MKLLLGDCVEMMGSLPACSVDAVVTDPPYELNFMGKGWDNAGVSFRPETWAAALRVLKPGGHLLAFGGTRTYHRIAVAIEDAGFDIRDCVCWLYGTGFPKSLDVSKAIDKAAGASRDVGRPNPRANQQTAAVGTNAYGDYGGSPGHLTVPATEAAASWDGWGTALKPAFEPIVVARKPLIGTVAANVLAHGTGALNIDACRVGKTKDVPASISKHVASETGVYDGNRDGSWGNEQGGLGSGHDPNTGRWPANVILDEEAAAMLDSQTGDLGLSRGRSGGDPKGRGIFNENFPRGDGRATGFGDQGGASRFFYCAKASRSERNAGLDGFATTKSADDGYGSIQTPKLDRAAPRENWEPHKSANHHPTVKPVAQMRYLVRLTTPPGGTVLDPFLGSGTTGIAARLEGFEFVGIEREPGYLKIAEARIAHWQDDPPPAPPTPVAPDDVDQQLALA